MKYLKITLLTLASALIALVLGLVLSFVATMLIYGFAGTIFYIFQTLFAAAGIYMISRMVAYHIIPNTQWGKGTVAFITGGILTLILLVAIFFSINGRGPYFLEVTTVYESAVVSMLTYTVVHLVFKHSTLPQYKWVNWLCFSLTFLWCFSLCAIWGLEVVLS